MGTLRYAILGLLSRKAMTGYDMAREFETTLFEFWTAKHSQIYPELKALTEQNLVEYTVEISGTVLEKKLYSITAAGRMEFLKWEMSRAKKVAIPKDEFRLRLFFSDILSKKERLELLQSQLTLHQEHLKHLLQNQEKFSNIPPKESEEFTDYLVLSGAVFREEANCKWLETCLELCRERNM